MEYEQKYKEALQRMKDIVVVPETEHGLQVLKETVFPELAEIEDEKIMKALRHLVTSSKELHFGIDNYDGIKWDAILAWLEMKKDITPIVVSNKDWDCQRAYSEGYQKGMAESNKKKSTAEEVLLKAGLKPFKDGNQWCILVGDNIQEGICGFGDTIEDALFEFLKEVCKEQKPMKWSNEDEEILERFLGWLQGTMGEKTYSSWLKSLRERFNLQQKQEWSDEDKALIENVCTALKGYALHERKVDLDEHAHRLEEMSERLKSIHPRHHWKPTEEQMEWLESAVRLSTDKPKIHGTIVSLYEDLKRL